MMKKNYCYCCKLTKSFPFTYLKLSICSVGHSDFLSGSDIVLSGPFITLSHSKTHFRKTTNKQVSAISLSL